MAKHLDDFFRAVVHHHVAVNSSTVLVDYDYTPYLLGGSLVDVRPAVPGPTEIELDVSHGQWLHQLVHGMEIKEAAHHSAVLERIGQLHSLWHPVPCKSELCYCSIHP